jgi:hypothetical protein
VVPQAWKLNVLSLSRRDAARASPGLRGTVVSRPSLRQQDAGDETFDLLAVLADEHGGMERRRVRCSARHGSDMQLGTEHWDLVPMIRILKRALEGVTAFFWRFFGA